MKFVGINYTVDLSGCGKKAIKTSGVSQKICSQPSDKDKATYNASLFPQTNPSKLNKIFGQLLDRFFMEANF